MRVVLTLGMIAFVASCASAPRFAIVRTVFEIPFAEAAWQLERIGP